MYVSYHPVKFRAKKSVLHGASFLGDGAERTFCNGQVCWDPKSLCGKDADVYPAPETNMTSPPENGWLEDFFVSFCPAFFSGANCLF